MHLKKISFVFVSLLLLATSSLLPVHAESKSDKNVAVIPGEYIVVFKDTVVDSDSVSEEISHTHGLTLKQKYSHALKGFAATIPDARLNAVKNDSRVAFISEDHVVSINAKPGTIVTQPNQSLPTGVRRIGTKTETGAGVGVAIIDTGIDLSHPDLKANLASQNKSCVTRTSSANDDNGHGTHVAGTVAGSNNTIGVIGVAPGAKLFAVKVLDRSGSGTWSSVICGIDWVTANAAAYGIKVANMSLSGAGSNDNNCGNSNNDALHKAICRASTAGVTFVVAAGNETSNSNASVPAAYDDAVITVSALADSDGLPGGFGSPTSYGADDTFASFSNYGPSVDIGAPGVAIYSTWMNGGYKAISGTSMASPHVAGAVALYKATHPTALLSEVISALQGAGEMLNFGHVDISGLHSEPVLNIPSL